MIRFVVARYENDSYEKFLGASSEEVNTVHVFNEEASSIFEKYNLGIQKHIEQGLADDDILVFAHGDLKILDQDFESKLEYAFKNVPKLGVAGVIGSKVITETAGWWLNEIVNHRGHLMQWVDNDENNKYHMIRNICNDINMTVVDGCILFVRGSVAKTIRFDSTSFPNSYNFYDYDYCLQTLENGWRVGVLDILVEHGSAGAGIYATDWNINKPIFINKWKNKGYNFPISTKPM